MTQYRSLADLKAVGRELKEKAKAAEEERRREEERRAARSHDAGAFMAAMAELGVTPSRSENRVEHAPAVRKPNAKAKALQASLEETGDRTGLSDDVESEDFVDEDGLYYRRGEASPDLPKRLRRGDWTIEARLDLHGLFVDEARVVFAKFLNDCRIRGYRCLSIVHGKGYGSMGGRSVLREKVRRWLKQTDDVIAFAQASPAKGDSGALIVLLRQRDRR